MKFSKISLQILNGTFKIALGTGVGRVLNLLAFVYAARSLGPLGFGTITFVLATLDLFALIAGASMGSTATKIIAQHKNEKGTILQDALSLIFSVSLVLTVALTSLILFNSNLISHYMFQNASFDNLIKLGSIFIFVSIWRGLQDGILLGFEGFRSVAVNKAMDGALTLIFMIVFVQWLGLNGCMLALILGSSVTLLYSSFKVNQKLKALECQIRFLLRSPSWHHLIGFSLPTLLSNLSIFPVTWLCSASLINSKWGATALGMYNAGYQLHAPIVFIPMMISSVALPILSVQWHVEDKTKFTGIFTKLVFSVFIIAVILSLATFVMIDLILIAFGPDYSVGKLAILLVVFAAPFHAVSQSTTTTLQSMSRAWYLPVLHLFFGATMLVITYCFVDQYGAIAMASALLISYALLALAKLTCIYLIMCK